MKKYFCISVLILILFLGCQTSENNELFLGSNQIKSNDGNLNTVLFYIPEDDESTALLLSASKGWIAPQENPEELTLPVEDEEYEIYEAEYYPELGPSMASPFYQGNGGHHIENEGVGSEWKDVNIFDDENGDKFIDTICIYESEHAFFYLEKGLNADLDTVEAIADKFEENYQIVRSYFGSESDVDNNGKVRFVIASFPESEADTMGYFYSLDQYDQETLDRSNVDYTSNESDVLYVNITSLDYQDEVAEMDLHATFAHEFQHMVYADMREKLMLPTEDAAWINEGLAMLTEYYIGFDKGHFDVVLSYFADMENTSLIGDAKVELYGMGLLLFRYIDQIFGTEAIQRIALSEETGIYAVEDGTGIAFDDLFSDFANMLLLTGRGISDEEAFDVEAFYQDSSLDLPYIEDLVYSLGYNNAEDGYYVEEFNPYSIVLLYWPDDPNRLYLDGKEGIHGFYSFFQNDIIEDAKE